MCARVIDAPAIFSFSWLQDRVEPPAHRERDREIERERENGREGKRQRERKRARLEGSKGDDVPRVRRAATSLYPRWRFQRHFDGETSPRRSFTPPSPPKLFPAAAFVRASFYCRASSLSLSLLRIRVRSLFVALLSPPPSPAPVSALFLTPSLSPVKRPVQLWRGYT